MAIDLSNGYEDLKALLNGQASKPLALVAYGDPADPANIAIEDESTSEVVLDFDRPED